MTVEAMKKFYALCNENAKAAMEAGVVAGNIPLMSMFASLIDILEEMEHQATEEQKEFIKTVAELTKGVVPKEDSKNEKEVQPVSDGPKTILGIVPQGVVEIWILQHLENLGCEHLTEIESIGSYSDSRSFTENSFFVYLKGRKAKLPNEWKQGHTQILAKMMARQNLPIRII